MNDPEHNRINLKKNDDIADSITREYSDVVTRFWALRDETTPGDTLHDRVFSTLFANPVTTAINPRYRKGEVNPSGTMTHVIHQVFSTQNNWKMFAPVAAIVILVGVAVVEMSTGKRGEEGKPLAVREVTLPVASDAAQLSVMMAAKSTSTSSASGNVDDIIAEINKEADADATLLSDADSDMALVNSDNQIICDYVQAYDETVL